jgi:hypothetical protein
LHKFNSGGHEWSLVMNMSQAKALKETLVLDVLDGGKSLQLLASDPYTAANVLYVLCERQCAEYQITDEQFGAALAGDDFEAAVTALLEELVDFFPQRQRGPLKKILARLETVKGETVALADRKIESPEMDQALKAILTTAEAEIDARLAQLTAGVGSGNPSA